MDAAEARAFIEANRHRLKSGWFSEFKYSKAYIAHTVRPFTSAVYWIVTYRPLVYGLAIWKAVDLLIWFFSNYSFVHLAH